MSIRVVMLGMPGAGKGTQSVRLAQLLQVPAISTGAIFRDNITAETPLGQVASRYISHGQLVPDEVTNTLVFDRLALPDASDGFLLDGYPRKVEQAEALGSHLAAEGHHLNAVIELVADRDEVVERLLQRARLENRLDDTAPIIRRRLEVYERETKPLTDYYLERDLLVTVDGIGPVAEVTERMLACLDAHETGCLKDTK